MRLRPPRHARAMSRMRKPGSSKGATVKRFRRRLINGIAAMSLLLFVLTVGFWVWDSHKGNPTTWNLFEIQTNSALYRFGAHRSSVALLRARPWPPAWEPQNWGEFNPQIDFFGFQVRWPRRLRSVEARRKAIGFSLKLLSYGLQPSHFFSPHGGSFRELACARIDVRVSAMGAATICAQAPTAARNVEQSHGRGNQRWPRRKSRPDWQSTLYGPKQLPDSPDASRHASDASRADGSSWELKELVGLID